MERYRAGAAGAGAVCIGRPITAAHGLSKNFGATRALINAHIAIRPGEVHALVGRNGAGKSTLVSLLTGLDKPDSGRITFDDAPAPPLADRERWRHRVACVYQTSNIVPALSVAENLFLNRQAPGMRPIGWRQLAARAGELLADYGIDVDPAARAGTLPIDEKQMLEIARALSFGAKFIILDEPTALLDGAKIAKLFTRLRWLQASGVAFLFISHHLDEVYEICDRVTVYRDGRHMLTAPLAGLDKDEMVEAMTGEDRSVRAVLEARRFTPAGARQAPALRISALTLDKVFAGIDVTVRAGEIVGLAGAGDSGAVQLGESAAGLRKPTSGVVEVDGVPVRSGDVTACLRAGIGFVPQDRRAQGVIPLRPVAENITLTAADRIGRHGFFSAGSMHRAGSALMERFDVKAEGPRQPVGALSGGNQQKVVMGRALASEPRALVLIRPTAGVDVKSKESLLGAVQLAAAEGCGALLVSDELDDLRIAHRVLVMSKGRLVGEFPAGWADNDLIAAIDGLGTAGRGNDDE